MKKDILSLGKLLVEELGLESSVDTLSRWMIHYISQQMVEVQNSTGKDKENAEERCYDTILKLWKHRAYYKTGDRPFENFEPIFRTLERLNPDNEEPFYFQRNYLRMENDNEEDVVKKYLVMATKIDQIVRIWLKFIFQQAADNAIDERTRRWIEAAMPLGEDGEASLILKIVNDYDIDKKEIADIKEEKTRQLTHRIVELKSFRRFNEDLIKMYKEEVISFEKSSIK